MPVYSDLFARKKYSRSGTAKNRQPLPSLRLRHAALDIVSSAQPPKSVLTNWSMAIGIWLSRLPIVFSFPLPDRFKRDIDGLQFPDRLRGIDSGFKLPFEPIQPLQIDDDFFSHRFKLFFRHFMKAIATYTK